MRAAAAMVFCTAAALAGCERAPMTQASDEPVSQTTVAPEQLAGAVARESDGLARYDGYGDLRFGMAAAAAERAWGGELKGTAMPGSSCLSMRPKWVSHPGDFSLMFEGGQFVRYDVGTPRDSAPGGGKVGMTASQIVALYRQQVATQPHKYLAGAKYLRIEAPHGHGSSNAALVFETGADGKITRWRVGVRPQVDYVEGCA